MSIRWNAWTVGDDAPIVQVYGTFGSTSSGADERRNTTQSQHRGGSVASRSVVTVVTTMLTATLVAATLGQGPRQSSALGPDARAAAVARLEAGQRIRVQGDTAEFVIGTFQRTGDGALVLSAEGGARSLPIVEMTGLWVRGHSVGKGALIGALVLGAGGAVLGAIACSDPTFCGFGEGGSNGASAGEGALVLGAVGAATGALLGAAIGAAVPKWHRRYP